MDKWSAGFARQGLALSAVRADIADATSREGAALELGFARRPIDLGTLQASGAGTRPDATE